jgi:hypothetical protein
MLLGFSSKIKNHHDGLSHLKMVLFELSPVAQLFPKKIRLAFRSPSVSHDRLGLDKIASITQTTTINCDIIKSARAYFR